MLCQRCLNDNILSIQFVCISLATLALRFFYSIDPQTMHLLNRHTRQMAVKIEIFFYLFSKCYQFPFTHLTATEWKTNFQFNAEKINLKRHTHNVFINIIILQRQWKTRYILQQLFAYRT